MRFYCLKNFLLLVFVFSMFSGLGQDKGFLEFSGKCIKDRQPLKGAHITLFKNGTKVTELNTGKNGKFDFYLDFGSDYKITFSYPGCVDMYLTVGAGAVPEFKEIYPIYVVDVTFFDLGKTNINYPLFRSPFTKVQYDGKKGFRDDEAYVNDFLKNLFIDPEEIKRQEELLALEKQQKEMAEKLKLEYEERIRKEQLEIAQKKAQEEAERMKKLLEQENKSLANADKSITEKENTAKNSMLTEEIKLTLEKEKKNIKEKQNKAVKAIYESDLLKIVATNERETRAEAFFKGKKDAESNEVIETLKKEAEVKAKSEQVVFESKTRSKEAVLNSRLKNQEIIGLIKTVAYNERYDRYGKVKNFPSASAYKPKGMVGVTTDLEETQFKSVYTITLSEGKTQTIYRKEKFSWGLVYYYCNNKEISELEYRKAVSAYNVPL